MSCIQKREKSLGRWLGALGGGLVFRGSNLCCSNVFGIYTQSYIPWLCFIPDLMDLWLIWSLHDTFSSFWHNNADNGREKNDGFLHSIAAESEEEAEAEESRSTTSTRACCAWLISRLLTFLKDFLTQARGKKWKPFNRYIRSWIVIKIPQSIGFSSISFWAERGAGG